MGSDFVSFFLETANYANYSKLRRSDVLRQLSSNLQIICVIKAE